MNHFDPSEFSCNCGCGGGFSDMDPAALDMLDTAREAAKIPFHINSAFRCQEHNKAVGGVPSSAHTTGHAVDILARSGREKWIIVNALISAGFDRIGIAGTFVHVDNDPGKSPDVIWSY